MLTDGKLSSDSRIRLTLLKLATDLVYPPVNRSISSLDDLGAIQQNYFDNIVEK